VTYKLKSKKKKRGRKCSERKGGGHDDQKRVRRCSKSGKGNFNSYGQGRPIGGRGGSIKARKGKGSFFPEDIAHQGKKGEKKRNGTEAAKEKKKKTAPGKEIEARAQPEKKKKKPAAPGKKEKSRVRKKKGERLVLGGDIDRLRLKGKHSPTPGGGAYGMEGKGKVKVSKKRAKIIGVIGPLWGQQKGGEKKKEGTTEKGDCRS